MMKNPSALPSSPLVSSDVAFQRMEDGDAAEYSSPQYAPPVNTYANSSSPMPKSKPKPMPMMIDSDNESNSDPKPNPLDESYESFATYATNTTEAPPINKNSSIVSRTIVWLIGLGLFGMCGILFLYSFLAIAFGGTLITIPAFVNAMAFILCTTNFAFRRFATLEDEEREAWKNLMWAFVGILTWDVSMLLTSYVLWIVTGWFFDFVAPQLETIFIIFIFPFASATLATWALWKLFPSKFSTCYEAMFDSRAL